MSPSTSKPPGAAAARRVLRGLTSAAIASTTPMAAACLAIGLALGGCASRQPPEPMNGFSLELSDAPFVADGSSQAQGARVWHGGQGGSFSVASMRCGETVERQIGAVSVVATCRHDEKHGDMISVSVFRDSEVVLSLQKMMPAYKGEYLSFEGLHAISRADRARQDGLFKLKVVAL